LFENKFGLVAIFEVLNFEFVYYNYSMSPITVENISPIETQNVLESPGKMNVSYQIQKSGLKSIS